MLGLVVLLALAAPDGGAAIATDGGTPTPSKLEALRQRRLAMQPAAQAALDKMREVERQVSADTARMRVTAPSRSELQEAKRRFDAAQKIIAASKVTVDQTAALDREIAAAEAAERDAEQERRVVAEGAQREAEERERGAPQWRSTEGYQQLRWGMSQADVKRLLPKARPDNDKGILAFAGPVADIPAVTLLYFAQDRLTGVTVSFKAVGRMRSHEEAFGALKDALEKKYREAVAGGRNAAMNTYRWETGKTTIALTHSFLDVLNPLVVTYESNELEFLRTRLDEAAAKDL